MTPRGCRYVYMHRLMVLCSVTAKKPYKTRAGTEYPDCFETFGYNSGFNVNADWDGLFL
jgi:hypothetical protein